MNVPESSVLTFLTVNILPLTDRSSPSFSHFIVGVGSPDVGHVITTLAPANKVSSSPIFASTTSRFSSEVIFRLEYFILGGSGTIKKRRANECKDENMCENYKKTQNSTCENLRNGS